MTPTPDLRRLNIDLYAEDGNVFARGILRGWIEVACSRCVAPARIHLEESVNAAFMPKDALDTDEDDEDAVTEEECGCFCLYRRRN